MIKAMANSLKKIPITRIVVNPMQPRIIFDENELQELAASIREHGVIQPIVVEACEDDFILHDGERRFRAARIAGLKVIPAIVTPPLNGTGPRERLERALVANVQRSEMHPIEEGLAYQRLITEFKLSVKDVSKRSGKSVARIYTCLGLLEFESEIQQLMLERKLPCADGKVVTALKSVPAGEQRIRLATALAARNATANMIIASCHRYLMARSAIKNKKATGSPAKHIASNNYPEWDALYQLGKVPPWKVVTESVMKTCDACPLRPIANETTCGECGLVIGLRHMLEMINAKQS